MKKKIFMWIGVVIVIAAGFIGVCGWLISGAGSACYYTQIDNSKIEEVNSRGGVIDVQGGMKYSYTLPAYNESGGGKDITFGASRKLREGAFIRLTVAPVRGVVEWSEVEYDEMPAAVQGEYEGVEEN